MSRASNCTGCGGYHGSVERGRQCLTDKLAEVRETLRHAKQRIEDQQKKIEGARRYLG